LALCNNNVWPHACVFLLAPLQARHVLLPGRPPLPYHVLSINTGIEPAAAGVPGAAQHATPVKPIDQFAARLHGLLGRLPPDRPLALAVVGGGAGGVELALALAFRLQQERRRSGCVLLDTVECVVRASDRVAAH
jgi:selenide,water dikinase